MSGLQVLMPATCIRTSTGPFACTYIRSAGPFARVRYTLAAVESMLIPKIPIGYGWIPRGRSDNVERFVMPFLCENSSMQPKVSFFIYVDPNHSFWKSREMS